MGNLWNGGNSDDDTTSGNGANGVDDYEVDPQKIRSMGLRRAGKDAYGNRIWKDKAGHQYTAAQLAKKGNGSSKNTNTPVNMPWNNEWQKYAWSNPSNDYQPPIINFPQNKTTQKEQVLQSWGQVTGVHKVVKNGNFQSRSNNFYYSAPDPEFADQNTGTAQGNDSGCEGSKIRKNLINKYENEYIRKNLADKKDKTWDEEDILDKYNYVERAICQLYKYNRNEFDELNSLSYPGNKGDVKVYVGAEIDLHAKKYQGQVPFDQSRDTKLEGITLVQYHSLTYNSDPGSDNNKKYYTVHTTNEEDAVEIIIEQKAVEMHKSPGLWLAHEGGHAIYDVREGYEYTKWVANHPNSEGHYFGDKSGKRAEEEQNIYMSNYRLQNKKRN